MSLLDRYGGAEAWDAFTAQLDEEEAAKNGCTCEDCKYHVEPDCANPSRIAWCRSYEEFTYLDDEANDCEEFEVWTWAA